MPEAANVGSQTSHGTPLSPSCGSADVLIEGKPIWRASADFQNCPQFTGTVPHVGGMVISGSTSVKINGLPALRKDDRIIEGGSQNTINTGESSVIIG